MSERAIKRMGLKKRRPSRGGGAVRTSSAMFDGRDSVLERQMRLTRVVPTFVVSDVGTTADWYAEELGFRCAGFPTRPPYVFASLSRDDVELMLLRIEGYQKPDISSMRPEGVWDAYFRMKGVAELYDLVRAKPFVRMPLKKQSYGDTEFEVRDPNGYILVFSELIE